MPLICNSGKAIACIKDCGPVFGAGYDLMIADKCSINANCIANIPKSYYYTNQFFIPSMQPDQYYKKFSGSLTGKKFRV